MRSRELIIDSFAGGGGASLGIEWATGRSPDVAVNHDAHAIAMHTENHPTTRHYREDVFRVNPREVTRGRPVGLLWLSPDCKHFSRAKGGKPVEKRIRGLAWVAIKWAVEAAPRVIILENVREFQDWGPLVSRWVCRAGCGWKGTESQTTLLRTRRRCPRCESLRVSPTEDMIPCPDRKGLTFRRFVGRLKGCGYAVEWKVLNAADYGAPTHRRRLFLVARNDGEEIGWPGTTHGDPKKIGRDLFSGDLLPWRTAAECIDFSLPCPSIFERKKPLAEKTMRRIALGVKRYVLDIAKPFIVDMQRENRAVVVPKLAPLVTNLGHGEGRDGRDRGVRVNPPDAPVPTIHAGGGSMAVIAPVLTEPARRSPPACTHAALVYSFLTKYFGTAVGRPLDAPAPTVTGKDRFGLVTVTIDGTEYVITDIGMRMLKPRELARAQGFPDSYKLIGTATQQVERIGNSVSPPPAEAMVRAQGFTPAVRKRRATAAK